VKSSLTNIQVWTIAVVSMRILPSALFVAEDAPGTGTHLAYIDRSRRAVCPERG
jgi:hypothetical protein